MNSIEVNEASKVNDIDRISTLVHKYGCGNKIHEVCGTKCNFNKSSHGYGHPRALQLQERKDLNNLKD